MSENQKETGKIKSNDLNEKSRKALDTLHANGELTWYPWIGGEYFEGGLMVVGESNYANSDSGPNPEAACKTVDSNVYFTENVVSHFCVDRKARNPTFDGITNILCQDCKVDILSAGRSAWGRIAYMDVIQQSMRGTGWSGKKGRSRPTKEMWAPGWAAVLRVIHILKPGTLLFVGTELAKHFSCKYLPSGCAAKMKEERKIGLQWWRTGSLILPCGKKIRVGAVPNPGGAHGFSPALWRREVRRYIGE